MSENRLPSVTAEDWVSVLTGQHPERFDIPLIGTYVQGHIDRTGDSFRQLQRRSGDRVHHSIWDRLSKNVIKEFPKPPTIVAIAETLSLPETLVLLSIGQTLGLNVSLSTGPNIIPIPKEAEALNERQRRAVWDMIMAFLPPEGEGPRRGGRRPPS